MSTPATTNTTKPVPASAQAPAQPTNAIVQATGSTPALEPHITTLQHAARLAIQHDRPIMLDYYVDTSTNKAFLGEDQDTKERILVKSKDEFTSSVQKSFKVGDDFIIMTENSLYIVSGKITKRKISMASLMGDL
jgi:hypothetical protein